MVLYLIDQLRVKIEEQFRITTYGTQFLAGTVLPAVPGEYANACPRDFYRAQQYLAHIEVHQ